MSERASWFRCDPSRLLGALAGMEPDSGYIYTVILMRIYEVGGPISDDEAVLSRRTGLSPKRVANSLSWLVKHGKVERLPCGSIDSETTHAELAFREKSVIDARNAGKESAKRKQNFHAEKHQQKQQISATTVERPLNGGATVVQRSSTDIDIEKDIERKKDKDPSPPAPREGDGEKAAAENSLEVECRKIAVGMPVEVDCNFVPVLKLLDEGLLAEDVLSAMRAIAEKNHPLRNWHGVGGWARKSAKDRIERAMPSATYARDGPKTNGSHFGSLNSESRNHAGKAKTPSDFLRAEIERSREARSAAEPIDMLTG